MQMLPLDIKAFAYLLKNAPKGKARIDIGKYVYESINKSNKFGGYLDKIERIEDLKNSKIGMILGCEIYQNIRMESDVMTAYINDIPVKSCKIIIE